MTDKNQTTTPGDDLADAWARGDGVHTEFGAADTGGHYSQAAEPTDASIDDNVIDVDHAPVKKKGKAWVNYLIVGAGGLIGIGALAAVGMFILNMFAAGEVPVKKSDLQTLPEVVSSKGSIPGVTDNSAELSSATAVPVQVAALDVPQASSPSSALSASSPVASGTSPIQPTGQQPLQTAGAASQATSSGPATAQKITSMDGKPNAAPVGNTVVSATANAACEPAITKPKKVSKANVSRSHEKGADIANGAQKKRSTQNVAKRTSKKPEKADSSMDVANSQIGVSSSSSNALQGFVIISIWPKTGDFQQAVLKDGFGKNYIVHQGDSLNGYRVLSINAHEHVVKTDVGVIR